MRNILKNVTIRIAAHQVPNVVKLQRTEGEKLTFKSGYLSHLILLIQEYLGFSYEIIEDIRTGTKLPNGTWTGVSGLIHREEADIAFPIALSNHERLEVMDFTAIYNMLSVRFFIRKPQEISKVFAITFPFTVELWIAALLVFLLAGIIVVIVFHVDAKLNRRKAPTVYEIFWALFGSFSNKGHVLFSPSGQSCKTIVLGWVIAMFILTASYSGALMSFITFPGLQPVPRTFPELVTSLQNGHYTASTDFHISIGESIIASRKGVGLSLKELWRRGKLVQGYPEVATVNRILKENHALIYYEASVEPLFKSAGWKRFVMSTDQLYSVTSTIGIRKKSPLRKLFSKTIRRCVETGMMHKFKREVLNEEMQKRRFLFEEDSSGPPGVQTLTLHDVAGTFFLLLLGYILSGIAFLVELILGKSGMINYDF